MSNVYHYTSGKHLEKILRTNRLIASNFTSQESMVWFSKDEKPPSSILPIRIDNVLMKVWWERHCESVFYDHLNMTFHPKEMKDVYRFVYSIENSNIIPFVNSPLYQELKNNNKDGGSGWSILYENELEKFIDTSGCNNIEDWYYSTTSSVSLHNARLEKLKDATWTHYNDLRFPVNETNNVQSPNWNEMTRMIENDTSGHWLDVPKYINRAIKG
jgi:hypothetical protein